MELNLYLIRNLLDGSMYVGKTIQTIEERWREHRKDAKHGDKTHLYNAMRKYGVENFVVDSIGLLEEPTDEQSLNDAERLMIRLLRINCRLYNLTDGGDGMSGWQPTEETRRKLSEAQKGSPLSAEHRRKMSESRKGMKHTEESRHKMSEAP